MRPARAAGRGRPAPLTLQRVSKDTAELEEPLAMAAVPDTSAQDHWPYGSLSQNSDRDIVGEPTGAGKPIHLAELVTSNGVDLFSRQRRQSQKIMQISGADKVELVTKKFVGAVRAQPVRTAEKKLGKIGGGITESGAALADQK